MKEIKYDGEKGIFIPLGEFNEGKFFTCEEFVNLRTKLLAQRRIIEDVLEQVGE